MGVSSSQYALRTDKPPPPPSVEDAASPVRASDERPIRCRACGAAITTMGDKIEVLGAHEHRRVNEAGFDYLLGCFRDAPGCVSIGLPTDRWTWFPGFAWRIALCASCRAHLGWAYSGGAASFYGLVLARLL